jgi:ppGpp synthetase/RelA/SpoT-type nucleotidyltranferase
MDQDPSIELDRQWALDQIKQYQIVEPRYTEYAQILEKILELAARAGRLHVIVKARSKAFASFAEKIQRKKDKYRDPLLRMTDLCGVRTVVQTQDEVLAISEFIEKHFEVDVDNSMDVSQRLKPTEFGYRSVHYVVQLKRGVFPSKEIPIEIPEQFFPDTDCPMKAEIQVRTLLEHAWAGFAHDRAYKSAFTLPDKWQRELAVLAGMLEKVDQAFSTIQAGLQSYESGYGAYLNDKQLLGEMEILETVLTCDPENYKCAHRLGSLAMVRGDWQKAIDLFSPHVEKSYQPILRDLGMILCRVYAGDPSSDSYRRGQGYLERASAPEYRDADALASLAGTWKSTNPERARQNYRKAYEIDPSDPYALSNYLVYEIAHRQDIVPVALMSPTIHIAMRRCREQADVGMNLPWAFYNLGIFQLLLGQPYKCLHAYAKALELSSTDWMIDTSLRLLNQLNVVRDYLPGYEWARRLLLLGRAVKFPTPETLGPVRELASPGMKVYEGQVVILTGGSDASVEPMMQGYHNLLLEAFHDFRGTIISGGTTSGIGRLAGDIQEAYPGAVRGIGYVSKLAPTGVSIDKRYAEIRYTTGSDFSPLEPLQAWIDLVASGIEPSKVKLLGVNGGQIAAVEYRMALALGAQVSILEGSGREAARLLQDDDWAASKNLFTFPDDPMTARAFISIGESKLGVGEREKIAESIHNAYREGHKTSRDPALAAWEKLGDALKESNYQEADHIFVKLRQIGCSANKVDVLPPPFEFSDQEVEIMAEMEHGRWVAERLKEGWKWSTERHIEKQTSPSLVAWSQLPDDVKEWDRIAVRKIPALLAAIGMQIARDIA